MDLHIKYIPSEANEWDVRRAIAAVLHSDTFRKNQKDRPVNFEVKLNESPLGGVRNDGTGLLTLPYPDLGQRFLRVVITQNPITINGEKLKFIPSNQAPDNYVAARLAKTPYVDPNREEERQKILWALDDRLRVDEVQFGVYYRVYPNSNAPAAKAPPRAFSIESKFDCSKNCTGWLRIDYDRKHIYIELGDRMTEQTGKRIGVHFSTVSKLAIGYDPNLFICFDTLVPPSLEELDFNVSTMRSGYRGDGKPRRRIGALNPAHAAVAEYAHQLRVVLYNDPSNEVKFMDMCTIAGLRTPLNCSRFNISIHADGRGFFTRKQQLKIKNWVQKLDWPVAFQLEALLRLGRLNTEDLLCGNLFQLIDRLCQDGRDAAGVVLRHFNEALDIRQPSESPVQCFKRVHARLANNLPKPHKYTGHIDCHHVVFTPTRLILEGPFLSQSNRVIRYYEGYEDHFLRVEFREEDSLHYRWDREVDAIPFLDERVGGILKNGFELAGRKFEFLAYSSSSLREHGVWFMHPFEFTSKNTNGSVKKEWVTSDSIRASLGDFSAIVRQPSRYAARMAQAFSATDPSVTIRRDEWEDMPDMGEFTDGVGTISRELGDRIWDALRASRPYYGERSIKPSVYQIRFLGYKGVVGIDERLEGIKMRLRPSMRKFGVRKGQENDDAPIEIARSFDFPNQSYLNRQMIATLEGRGVVIEAFVALQQAAIADARMIDDSLEQFRRILRCHSLGNQFGLHRIVRRLNDLGLDLTNENRDDATIISDAFLARLRNVAMNHVLRDIKHRARIPVPKSYQLVGVADEGPAYQKEGLENVLVLQKSEIYACIQNFDDPEPTYLRGICMISRNPIVHPGDIQRVFAIGKPPQDKICSFAHLKNVVVFPSVGDRPLTCCLAGGDLDGDTYDVIQYPPLLPSLHESAGKYDSVGVKTIDRDSTVHDICDFIVEYIRSDVLGLLSDRHLIIADQSKYGIRDHACFDLATLCSQAVDYPKNGIPVDLDETPLPALLIRSKPDWHAAEVVDPRSTDYYISDRALGVLYRSIELNNPRASPAIPAEGEPGDDAITRVLEPLIQYRLTTGVESDGDSLEIEPIFRRYVDELQYMCVTHTLTNDPQIRLLEEEVVIGTILAKCTERRHRTGRVYRLRLQTGMLVQGVQQDLWKNRDTHTPEELSRSLERSWSAWKYSIRHKKEFGANSFGLVALGTIFDILDRFDNLPQL